MQSNATLYAAEPGPASAGLRAVLDEIGSVGTRQIADRGRVVSRLYTAVLAGAASYPPGQPVWIEWQGAGGQETFIGYPVLQKGRVLRLHRREGELMPGLLLEPLGTYERGGSPTVTGGGLTGVEWFVTEDGPSIFHTADFRLYDDVPELRTRFNGSICWAGYTLVLGGVGEVFATTDGESWQTYPVGAAAEVWALAWDGAVLWLAAEGGTFTMNLTSGQVTQIAAQPAYGLSWQFMNFDLYRAELAGAGTFALYARNGSFFRNVPLNVDALLHNWVVLGGRHYTTELDGRVVRFDGSTLAPLGSLKAEGRSGADAATFLVRDTVLAVSHGRLGRVSGDAVTPVFDFGGDVRAFPAQGGFIVVRTDGLLYRVRRV